MIVPTAMHTQCHCSNPGGFSFPCISELVQDSVEAISEDKAKRILDRIDFLRRLREQIVDHPELEERIKLCDSALDLPDWWIPGMHDRDLIIGVARHGLSRMEYYVLNDPELCFKDILKRHLGGEDLVDRKELEAFQKRKKRGQKKSVTIEENSVDVVENDKGDTTAEEEQAEVKKKDDEAEAPEAVSTENIDTDEKKEEVEEKPKKKEKKKREEKKPAPPEEIVKETRSRRKSTKDATEATKLAIEASKMAKAEAAKSKEKKTEVEKEKPKEKDDADNKAGGNKANEKDAEAEGSDTNSKVKEETAEAEKPEDSSSKLVKEECKDESASTPVEVTAPPRRKVSVSIPPPQISIQQMEQMAKGGMIYDMEVMNDLMAQTYASAIRWPKDKILEIRLSHVIACVESGEWTVGSDYPLGDHLLDEEVEEEVMAMATTTGGQRDDTSTPMSESSELSYEDPNVLTHSATSARRQRRGRRPLDAYAPSEEKSKIRTLLQQPTLAAESNSEDAR